MANIKQSFTDFVYKLINAGKYTPRALEIFMAEWARVTKKLHGGIRVTKMDISYGKKNVYKTLSNGNRVEITYDSASEAEVKEIICGTIPRLRERKNDIDGEIYNLQVISKQLGKMTRDPK